MPARLLQTLSSSMAMAKAKGKQAAAVCECATVLAVHQQKASQPGWVILIWKEGAEQRVGQARGGERSGMRVKEGSGGRVREGGTGGGQVPGNLFCLVSLPYPTLPVVNPSCIREGGREVVRGGGNGMGPLPSQDDGRDGDGMEGSFLCLGVLCSGRSTSLLILFRVRRIR